MKRSIKDHPLLCPEDAPSPSLQQILERMNKDETGYYETDLENRGYNQALSDVIKLLSELETKQ